MRHRTIAFAYAAAGPQHLQALYHSLAEGLIENLKSVTDAPILQLSDDKTETFKGVSSILRIERNIPLMTWRMKAHQLAHSMAEEILFVEPDVRLNEDILDVFEQSFDIAVTPRIDDVAWGDESLSEKAPYTQGTTFSRSDQFWREAKMYCQSLPEREQNWMGDLLSIAHVIGGGKYKVLELDGSVYNRIPNDPTETNAKALHYKGKRKAWLFPQMTEAA